MFSSRVPDDRRPNDFALALARARGRGPVIDLTASNPTCAGIRYPPDLLALLSDRAALTYRPAPLGLADARDAIAGTYAGRGLRIGADRIVLTASTSEAYSILFKLLCAPAGDSVMVPVPSYPLFEYLSDLEGVRAIPYPLEFHGR